MKSVQVVCVCAANSAACQYGEVGEIVNLQRARLYDKCESVYCVLAVGVMNWLNSVLGFAAGQKI